MHSLHKAGLPKINAQRDIMSVHLHASSLNHLTDIN